MAEIWETVPSSLFVTHTYWPPVAMEIEIAGTSNYLSFVVPTGMVAEIASESGSIARTTAGCPSVAV